MDITRVRGFTLTEVLVITAVIGILSSIAVANYQSLSAARDMQTADSVLSAAAALARQVAIKNTQGVTDGAAAAVCLYEDEALVTVREAKAADTPAKCTNAYKQTQEIRAFSYPVNVTISNTDDEAVSCFCFASNGRFNQSDKCQACATSSIIVLANGDKAYETNLF